MHGLINEKGVTLDSDLRLYIVDDNATVRKLLSEIFKGRWKAETCENGFELMKKLRDNLRPSVIILDINLPGMDGMSVMKKLKGNEAYREYPVVFITANSSKKTELRCLKEGAVDFITKPFDPEVVYQRVRHIADQYVTASNLALISTPESAVRQNFENLAPEQKKLTYQLLMSLSTTIDAKDYYTRGHSSRVAAYSLAIGHEIGMDSEELDVLYHCALLHDIGKIGVSDVILRKPGILDEAEMNVIRRHPVIGYNILRTITLMPDIARSARWHHERFDGTGYPDKLKGTEIPMLARIIAVADSYDAMTSDRSYRPGMPKEEARNEIVTNRGTQFDPYLADLMVELIDKGMVEKKDEPRKDAV